MLLQLCMLASLLWSFLRALTLLALSLPLACIRCASAPLVGPLADESAVFYEGEVRHERRKPVRNTFRYALVVSRSSATNLAARHQGNPRGCEPISVCSYPVRMALVSLDRPLRWWRAQAGSFISAEEARNLAGTDGEALITLLITSILAQDPYFIELPYSDDDCMALNACNASTPLSCLSIAIMPSWYADRLLQMHDHFMI